MHILILNGPNLNLLGIREPEIYGLATLSDIEVICQAEAKNLNVSVDFRQSNHEGTLIDWIQEARETADGLLLNAAAYTHTSIAIHDALKVLKIPVIEVHLSDPAEREAFRHHSFVSPPAVQVIAGQGQESYVIALKALHKILSAD